MVAEVENSDTLEYKRDTIWLGTITCDAISCGLIVWTVMDLSDRAFTTIRRMLLEIFPGSLNCPIVSRTAYDIAAMTLCVILSIVSIKKINKYLRPKRIVRNKKYILKLFDGRGNRSPLPTRKRLIRESYGEGKIENDSEKAMLHFVDKNVAPIKSFLGSKGNDDKILFINARWGSGKTTSILIAINESRANNRYIYEAAFKYRENINEFINDLLKTLSDVMAELGVKSNLHIESLVRNLDCDLRKTLIGVVKNKLEPDEFSSDLILKLNQEYRLKRARGKTITCNIIVIIDDLDRMEGGDIIRILSILSILRNLEFVKIVIPADLDIIRETLTMHEITDAPRFIEKYLPTQRSLKIYSGYDMAEKILFSKIQAVQGSSVDVVRPAMAAIIIGLLSKEMLRQTMNMKCYRYYWLETETIQGRPKEPNEQLDQLLQAPIIMKKVAGDGYSWNARFNNLKKFQNIIFALRKRIDYSDNFLPVNTAFSEEEYKIIDAWIFKYIERRWEIFGFTIRDALDILDGVDYSELPDNPAAQFVCIFNQLFPDEQLILE